MKELEVGEAAVWLKTERARLGASTGLVARLATLIANRQGDPVRIHQQQISDIENWESGRGPRSIRPWFRHVRAAFETGLIADALGQSREGDGELVPARGNDGIPGRKTASAEEPSTRYSIVDADGTKVGEIVWFEAQAR